MPAPSKKGGSSQIYNTSGLINNEAYKITGTQHGIQQPLFAGVKGGAKKPAPKKKVPRAK